MIILLALTLVSCGNSKRENTAALVEKWIGKEIIIPANSVFTIQGRDTVNFQIDKQYRVLTYVDSTGCTSCKLKFTEWKKFMQEIDSLQLESVQFLFFLCPKKSMEIYQSLRINRFYYPVCINNKDELNKLNNFSSNMTFQSFLLDQENKVIAIGNPIDNPKVKELYLKIIQGERVEREDESRVIRTKVDIGKTSVSLDDFDWHKEQKVTFSLKNIGDKPLVIEDVNTSCGCTTVEFSKEPVRFGRSLDLHVTYKADHPEHFSKTITVYCNVESSPIKLTILGNAQ